jgi:hypothetical protein
MRSNSGRAMTQGEKRMNVIRKIMMGLGGVVVVALVLALASPKTMRAAVSTLVTVTNTPSVTVANAPTVNVASLPAVQFSGGASLNANVTNTAANPAITWDADRSTRIPYQSTIVVPTTQLTVGQSGFTLVGFTTVQAGYRLVIQNVSFNVQAESNNPVPTANICTAFNPNTCFPSFTGTFTGTASGFGQADVANANIIRYVGPGDTPEVQIFLDAANPPHGVDIVTVSGYLEDCAVTGCPAAGF